ncbi:MAG: response regulator [bacterium]|nr:response regulator [bacterium]
MSFREARPHAVVTDMRMPESDGMALLEQLAAESPETPVFCITAWPQWEASAAAIQGGAREYLKWPRDLDRLIA